MSALPTASGLPLHKIVRWLFALNAIVWLALGVLTLTRMSSRGLTVGVWVLAVLMAGNVAAMALCAWGVGRRQRVFDLLALLVLVANILLTFTDQFGLPDLLTLLLDLALLYLMLRLMFLEARTGKA